MEPLLSLQNSLTKRLVKLRRCRAYRAEQQAVVVVGGTLCRELAPAIRLFVRQNTAIDGIGASEIIPTADHVLEKMSGTPGCTMVAEMRLPPESKLETAHRLLVLDGISDPGNLGTLLRTVAALGWDGAVLLEGCVDPFNDKALRASRGALFTLPYRWMSRSSFSHFATGFTPLVAHLGGDPLPKPHPDRLLLVMGNEAHGPSPEILSICQPVAIPLAGQMESLNVAAAGAILLHAFQKRV